MHVQFLLSYPNKRQIFSFTQSELHTNVNLALLCSVNNLSDFTPLLLFILWLFLSEQNTCMHLIDVSTALIMMLPFSLIYKINGDVCFVFCPQSFQALILSCIDPTRNVNAVQGIELTLTCMVKLLGP